MSETDVVVRQETPLTAREVMGQVNLIQQIMADAMKKGEHYGTIQGCGDKMVLLKSGAEKLNLTFRMAPDPEIDVVDLGNGHREYRIKCVMRSIVSGSILGAGVGSCSTLESKYRWRQEERKCPKCGKAAIIKGKTEYGGGWLCFKKKEGCGEKFSDGDQSIEGQQVGRIENVDIADQYNTCLKMAKKRAMVDAVLTCTAASDIFTQDLDEEIVAESSREPIHQAYTGTDDTKPAQPKQQSTQPATNTPNKLSESGLNQITDMTNEMIAAKWNGWTPKRAQMQIQKGTLLGDDKTLPELAKEYQAFLASMKSGKSEPVEAEIKFQ